MHPLRSIALAASLTLAAAASHAALVAANPWAPGASDAGAFSQASQQLASQFSVAAATSLTSASWHGTMFGADPLNTGDLWNFSINIYADGGAGAPGALISTAAVVADVTDGGVDTAGERDYLFEASFPGIALNSGSYFLSILNTGTQSTFRWTKGTGTVDAALNSGGGWAPWNETERIPPNYMLFGDEQAVPEPAPLALVGAALLALSLRRRRA
jgi:hypothetical protein